MNSTHRDAGVGEDLPVGVVERRCAGPIGRAPRRAASEVGRDRRHRRAALGAPRRAAEPDAIRLARSSGADRSFQRGVGEVRLDAPAARSRRPSPGEIWKMSRSRSWLCAIMSDHVARRATLDVRDRSPGLAVRQVQRQGPLDRVARRARARPGSRPGTPRRSGAPARRRARACPARASSRKHSAPPAAATPSPSGCRRRPRGDARAVAAALASYTSSM